MYPIENHGERRAFGPNNLLLFFMMTPLVLINIQALESKEIVSKAILAVGGDDYLRLEGIIVKGVSKTKVPLLGEEVSEFVVYIKGRQYRREMSVKGYQVITLFDEQSCYMYVNGERVDPSEDLTKSLRDQYKNTLSTLAKADALGIHLSYLGRQEQDGRRAHVIGAHYPDGDIRKFYFDETTSLVWKIELKEKERLGFGRRKKEVFLRNYRQVNGLRFPFLKETYVDGKKVSEEHFVEIKLGENLEDDLFKKP